MVVNVVDADCVLHLNGLYRIIAGDGCGFDTGIPYSQQNLCHSLQSGDGNLDFGGGILCIFFFSFREVYQILQVERELVVMMKAAFMILASFYIYDILSI